jgi:hypothetical protein
MRLKSTLRAKKTPLRLISRKRVTEFRVFSVDPERALISCKIKIQANSKSTFSFLAIARGRHPFRGLPPGDPAGLPNTNAGNTLRPSPAFLLLPPHATSPQFESYRRDILEPLEFSGP